MTHQVYKVTAEEKLSDIAKKFDATVSEIKLLNPNGHFFKAIMGAEYAVAMQELMIPASKANSDEEKNEENFLKTLAFQPVARYRCNQINLTKVADEVTFSSEIKTQYLHATAKDDTNCHSVKLEDYIYSIHPKEIQMAFQIAEPIEFIRNDIKLTQNSNAEIVDILNMIQLKRKWQHFKTEELPKIDFFQKLKEQNSKATADIITTGDAEFSNVSILKNIVDKNLFYHILLKANLGENLKDFITNQPSQIFPDQNLCMHVVKSKGFEDDTCTVFELAGILQREHLSLDQLMKQYNEIYKPVIKFSFTEFDYYYRISYTIDKMTGLLTEATAVIIEKVKNNYESITQFQIKKVEL